VKKFLLASLMFLLSYSANAVIIRAENFSTMSGIQIEQTADVGGGNNVGYFDAGDWLQYAPVTITTAGQYTFAFRVAGNDSLGQFVLYDNGATLITVSVPMTGGWQNWTTVTYTANLTSGQHVFKILTVSRSFNLNWFSYDLGIVPAPVLQAASSSAASSSSSAPVTASGPLILSSSTTASSSLSSTSSSCAPVTNCALSLPSVIRVNWTPPTQRENGTPLAISELCCYDIRARDTNNNVVWETSVSPGSTTSYIFTLPTALQKSINRFEIAAADTNGLYSEWATLTPTDGSVLASSSSVSTSSSKSSSSSSSRKFIAAPTQGSIQ